MSTSPWDSFVLLFSFFSLSILRSLSSFLSTHFERTRNSRHACHSYSQRCSFHMIVTTGPGESGKSTIFKQMKVRCASACERYRSSEFETWRNLLTLRKMGVNGFDGEALDVQSRICRFLMFKRVRFVTRRAPLPSALFSFEGKLEM